MSLSRTVFFLALDYPLVCVARREIKNGAGSNYVTTAHDSEDLLPGAPPHSSSSAPLRGGTTLAHLVSGCRSSSDQTTHPESAGDCGSFGGLGWSPARPPARRGVSTYHLFLPGAGVLAQAYRAKPRRRSLVGLALQLRISGTLD